jgi:diaminopimelate epimerase
LALRSNDQFSFYKYNSAGNDFILIEAEPFVPSQGWAYWCHRRFGIGADGILFYCASTRAEFKMVYLNADGAQVSMCGNGARAVAAHYFKKNPIQSETSFEVGDVIYSSRREDQLYSVVMNECKEHGAIPVDDFNLPKNFIHRDYLNTGVPHIVLESNEDIEQIDLKQIALPLRHDKRFLQGVNINIYQVLSNKKLKMRTFERGVEDETFACGTGAMAVAQSLWLHRPEISLELEVMVLGGLLRAKKTDQQTELLGPSECVYFGKTD